MRKVLGILVIVILALSMILGGCGGKKETVESQSSAPAPVSDDWKPIQVLGHAWKAYDKVGEEKEPWHTADYHEGFGMASDGGWQLESTLCAWSGDLFYHLSTYYDEGEETKKIRFLLTCVDVSSMEETVIPFDFPDEEGRAFEGNVRAISMDAMGDQVYLFLAQYDEEWYLLHYNCIEMGRNQESLKITDFAPQLFGEERCDLWELPCGFTSKDGDVCFIDVLKKRLELFSASGELKERRELLDIEGTVWVSLIGRAQDGTPIFQMTDWNGHLSYFTPEEVTYQGNSYVTFSCLDDEGGMLLWLDSDLVRWNVETGEAEKLCNLSGLQSSCCMGIRKNSKGQIVLAYDEGDGLCFYRYDAGVAQNTVTLRIAAFLTDSYLEDCAADYERTHPGVSVEFVEFDNPFQNSMALNRLAEECKGENGPDLIRFTTMEQAIDFQGGGCLAPMSDLLSAETKKGLFRCVLEMGKMGNEVYAIPLDVSLSCLMTSKENWTKDAWTLKELMDCLAARKKEEPDLERFMTREYATFDSQQLLYELCILNLEDTPFVDFEKGNCDFHSKGFKELLQFCKENADKPGNNYDGVRTEMISQMREGKAFAYLFVGGLASYSSVRADLGKDFVTVGMPAETVQGFIASSNSFMTLNAFSKNQELAADFLEYMLSEKCQVKYGAGSWVRKDVIESHVRERVTHVIYDTAGSEGKVVEECLFQMDNRGASMPLAVDENGDSFVKEYLELMDRARAHSTHVEVQKIISEEADAYFAGSKTVDEVADAIQKRVELFLKEQ